MLYQRKDLKEANFYSVALFMIFVGAAILGFGIVGWVFNSLGYGGVIYHAPSYKVMGGLVIILLSYIVLELELLRLK